MLRIRQKPLDRPEFRRWMSILHVLFRRLHRFLEEPARFNQAGCRQHFSRGIGRAIRLQLGDKPSELLMGEQLGVGAKIKEPLSVVAHKEYRQRGEGSVGGMECWSREKL